jgi:hypothetical protein
LGISAVVFDERGVPTDGDLSIWLRFQRAAGLKEEWQRPETSSSVLGSWFSEMREAFPSLTDADPDDLRGTDYSFYRQFVCMEFAGPVGEEGILMAWKLAYKHGLRMLVGDKLLPRVAPEGKRLIAITALEGSEVGAQSTGVRNISIAVLDPDIVPASGTKQWVRDQLNVEIGSDDSSIIASDQLKKWNDEFKALNLTRAILFRNFILLRIQPKDLNRVAPTAIELAKRFHLGISIFEDL